MANSILEDLSEQTFTESTIKRMFALVNRAKTDAEFQKLIYGLVNHAMPGQWKDYRRELSTIFSWFKKNIDYRRDPYGVELLQDVWSTLDRKRADCDDATTFLAAAAEVLGAPARIVTVSTRPNKEPNHVYAEAQVGGRWLGLDATVPQSYVGWTPPQVTARRIWTRKELGLSGGEDEEGIEGLGMSHDIYDNGDFDGTMTPVSGRLAPGVPDNVSHTRGAAIPGTTNVTPRRIWRAPIANVSDWTSNPRPGGGVYGPALPIAKRPLPQDLWYLVDRKFVPKVLDPDSAWWGKVPTSKEDLNRMFPGSEGTMANYLQDVASVPASAIDEVTNDVRTQLAMGEIGEEDVLGAIEEGLEDYALGLPPRMKLPPSQRKPRPRGGWKGEPKKVKPGPVPMPAMPPPLVDRQYLVKAPAPGRKALALALARTRAGHLNDLGDLGDAMSDAAAVLASGVKSGSIPASSVNQVIDSVASAITGQAATAPKPVAQTPASVAKTAIPIGMIALLAGAAWLMTQGGGPRKYRRNPSRRRGRNSRGGGFDLKTALLWGGGGLAAYFLLLRPGAPLMPAALTSQRPAAPAGPSGPSATQTAIAAGAKVLPGIFDFVKNLFGGGSSSPTPAPSGMITSYDQLFAPTSPAPSSTGMVTSYDQLIS